MEDKNVLFSYQGEDDVFISKEHQERKRNQNKNSKLFYKHSTDKTRVDEYWFERPKHDKSFTLNYSKTPEFQEVDYIPPLFREKYELCVWKVFEQGVIKIRQHYFTPDACIEDPSITFSAQQSLDGKSILMYENSESNDQIAVLVIDLTDFIVSSQFDVKISDESLRNSSMKLRKNNNSASDMINRFTLWDDGRYLLVGVSHIPNSTLFHEFAVYNTESKEKVSTLTRINQEHLKDRIIRIKDDPKNDSKLVFITKQDSVYTVLEVDPLENHEDVMCTVAGTQIKNLQIANDLSTMFIISLKTDKKKGRSSYHLYTIDYGKDVDFDHDDVSSAANLGGQVLLNQIIDDKILIIYYERREEKIVLFGKHSEDTRVFKNDFHMQVAQKYSILDRSDQLVCITQTQNNRFDVVILGQENKKYHEAASTVNEFMNYRYEFPELLMIKGGTELITYNFLQKTFTYCKLPSPIAVLHKGSEDKLNFSCLLDIGDYYVPCKFDFTKDPIAKTLLSVKFDLNFIDKSVLPASQKVMNLLSPKTRVVFKNKTTEDAYILHCSNYLVAYSCDSRSKTDVKK